MSLAMTIYLIDVIENFRNVLAFSIVVSLWMIAFYLVCLIIPPNDAGLVKRSRAAAKFAIALLSFSTLTHVAAPDKSTMYAMLAADAGEKLVQSEEFKRVGGKALEALNKKLDELNGEVSK